MANVFLTGFDDHDATGLAYEWTVAGSPTIVSGLTGNCVRLTEGMQITRTVAAAQTYTVGVRLRVSAHTDVGPFFGVGDGVKTHLVFTINANGTMTVYMGGGSAAPSLS